MISIVLVEAAELQLAEIDAWWREHRPAAATLIRDELERCVALLQNTPELGTRFRKTFLPGVRRIAMRRSKHLIYYVHDSTNSIVYILSVWGAPKEGHPPLVDPR